MGKKKLFVMPPAETEIPEKIGDKEYMEKSNIHLIVETKEKKMGKGKYVHFRGQNDEKLSSSEL